jgi:hypothetical protein
MTVYGGKRISISLRRTGGRYEKRKSELINQIYFSNYKKMADFNDYLGNYGNIKHCWGIHVRKMKSLNLPYCSYKAFH